MILASYSACIPQSYWSFPTQPDMTAVRSIASKSYAIPIPGSSLGTARPPSIFIACVVIGSS